MIYFITRNKTGQSIRYLQKMLEIGCSKTAWTIAHKIHKAMQKRDSLYKLGGLLEIDDAYLTERTVTCKRGRGADRKSSVLITVGTRIYKDQVKPSYVKIEVTENIKNKMFGILWHGIFSKAAI